MIKSRAVWTVTLLAPLMFTGLLTGCKDNGTIAPAGSSSAGPSGASTKASTSAVPTPTGTESTASASAVTADPSASASPDPSAQAAQDLLEKQIINDTGLDKTNGTAAYTGLQTVKVGAKYLFDAPAVWSEISRESEQGQSLPFDEVIVSADVTKWRRDAAPGISASYHSNTTPQEAAGEFVARSRDFFASCKAGPQHEYDDGSNVGVARTYTDCTGQAGSDETLLAVKPNDSTDVIVVDSVVKDARDAAAIALAIRSVRAVTP